MLDDIVLFVQIVRRGGLAGAAQYLGLPPATVTRRLQKLERELGCQLLHRSARQFVLTQEGERYYQSYVDLVEQFETTQQQLTTDSHKLNGRLRVLAPTNISHGFLRPFWTAFIREYPEIQLEVILSNQLEDMPGEKADIAIRMGRQPDSLLFQQKLGEIETIIVASPTYLQSTSALLAPEDLMNHRVIGTTLRLKWTLNRKELKISQEVFPRFHSISNDLAFVKHLAEDGLGIALLPFTEVKAELQAGRLVRLLPSWRGPLREIYAVWPSGRLLSEKAKALKEAAKKYVEENGGIATE